MDGSSSDPIHLLMEAERSAQATVSKAREGESTSRLACTAPTGDRAPLPSHAWSYMAVVRAPS